MPAESMVYAFLGVVIVTIWYLRKLGMFRAFRKVGRDFKTAIRNREPKDVTCETTKGHTHQKPTVAEERNYGKRYVVKNEKETGYVILNGVKRKLTDCGDL